MIIRVNRLIALVPSFALSFSATSSVSFCLQGQSFYWETRPSCRTSLVCRRSSPCSSLLSWSCGQRHARMQKPGQLSYLQPHHEKLSLFLWGGGCSVNVDKTCYTGALCGLGCNSQVQEGIFPDHDIELTFDVKFDVEDIIEVTHRWVCERRLDAQVSATVSQSQRPLLFLSFSLWRFHILDQRPAARHKPAGVRGGRRHVASGTW